jgi:hypothetical protein
LVSVAVGVALSGQGFGLETYLNPMAWVMIPRLTPFALATLSIMFGVIYFVVEGKAARPVSATLTIVQMIFLILAAFGHIFILRFWSDTLSGRAHGSLPLWSALLFPLAFLVSLTAFGFNIIGAKQSQTGDLH